LLMLLLLLLDQVHFTDLPSPTLSLSLHTIIIFFLLCINKRWAAENAPLLRDHVVHTLMTLGRVNGRTEQNQ
jgi:hypothetical protein